MNSEERSWEVPFVGPMNEEASAEAFEVLVSEAPSLAEVAVEKVGAGRSGLSALAQDPNKG